MPFIHFWKRGNLHIILNFKQNYEPMRVFLRLLICISVVILNSNQAFSVPPCDPDVEPPQIKCLGTVLYENGDKYVGDLVKGERSGRGTYYYISGKQYEGDWLKGAQHGKGKFSLPNGNKYVGDFLKGKWTGSGTLTNFFGDKYVGEVKNGKMHGQGILTTNSGYIYEGLFANDIIVSGQGRVKYGQRTQKLPEDVCPGALNAKCPNHDLNKPVLSFAPNRSKF